MDTIPNKLYSTILNVNYYKHHMKSKIIYTLFKHYSQL